jgi:hypothetical protein
VRLAAIAELYAPRRRALREEPSGRARHGAQSWQTRFDPRQTSPPALKQYRFCFQPSTT